MKKISFDELIVTHPLEKFRGLSTFGALSDEAILKILKEGNILSLGAGDMIFNANDIASQFYILIDGKVSLYRSDEEVCVTVGVFGPGEEFGFAGMIALRERKSTALSELEGIVLEINSDQFLALHFDLPLDFGVLMLNLAREMARTLDKRGDLIFEFGHREY